MNTENNNQKRKDLIVIFGLIIMVVFVVVVILASNTQADNQQSGKTDDSTKKSIPDDNKKLAQEPSTKSDNKTDVVDKSNVTEIPTTITKALPKLIDLGSTRCKPCIAMEPILEELRNEYNGIFNVEFINVNENQAEAQKYNINLIPTQIFFDANGTELYRHVGFFSKEEIIKKWKELGFNLTK